MNTITRTGRRLGNLVAGIAAMGACLVAPAALAAPPVINSMVVSTPSINVTSITLPARIKFDVSSAAGVASVMVDVRSRDYKQGQRREVAMPYLHKAGVFYFETQPFDNFNKPGAWDIRYVTICDVNGECVNQDFYGLAAVAARQITVSNSHAADLSAPAVSSALIYNKALTTHSSGQVQLLVKLTLTDSGRGATAASICARTATESQEACGYWELPASVTNANQWVTIPFTGNTYEAGTWHIAVVEIVDRAGNQLFVNDPGQLNTMFPTGRTFTVTNGS